MKNLKDLFKTVMPQYFMYMGPRRTHCVAKFEVLSPTRVQFKLNPKFDKFIIDLEDPEGTGTIRVKDGVLQLDHKVFGAMEFIPMTRGTNFKIDFNGLKGLSKKGIVLFNPHAPFYQQLYKVRVNGDVIEFLDFSVPSNGVVTTVSKSEVKDKVHYGIGKEVFNVITDRGENDMTVLLPYIYKPSKFLTEQYEESLEILSRLNSMNTKF